MSHNFNRPLHILLHTPEGDAQPLLITEQSDYRDGDHFFTGSIDLRVSPALLGRQWESSFDPEDTLTIGSIHEWIWMAIYEGNAHAETYPDNDNLRFEVLNMEDKGEFEQVTLYAIGALHNASELVAKGEDAEPSPDVVLTRDPALAEMIQKCHPNLACLPFQHEYIEDDIQAELTRPVHEQLLKAAKIDADNTYQLSPDCPPAELMNAMANVMPYLPHDAVNTMSTLSSNYPKSEMWLKSCAYNPAIKGLVDTLKYNADQSLATRGVKVVDASDVLSNLAFADSDSELITRTVTLDMPDGSVEGTAYYGGVTPFQKSYREEFLGITVPQENNKVKVYAMPEAEKLISSAPVAKPDSPDAPENIHRLKR
ncbi:MAG: hypothetical protein GY774_23355 [Planctomycetes bacterium]|nr:hypothetical protein [Planctomycetota bacterium]